MAIIKTRKQSRQNKNSMKKTMKRGGKRQNNTVMKGVVKKMSMKKGGAKTQTFEDPKPTRKRWWRTPKQTVVVTETEKTTSDNGPWTQYIMPYKKKSKVKKLTKEEQARFNSVTMANLLALELQKSQKQTIYTEDEEEKPGLKRGKMAPMALPPFIGEKMPLPNLPRTPSTRSTRSTGSSNSDFSMESNNNEGPKKGEGIYEDLNTIINKNSSTNPPPLPPKYTPAIIEEMKQFMKTSPSNLSPREEYQSERGPIYTQVVKPKTILQSSKRPASPTPSGNSDDSGYAPMSIYSNYDNLDL